MPASGPIYWMGGGIKTPTALDNKKQARTTESRGSSNLRVRDVS